jgi:glutaredoxin
MVVPTTCASWATGEDLVIDPTQHSDLIVYYRPGCIFAAKLRAKLRLSRMPYSVVEFGQDAAADEAVRNISDGNEISPTVRLGNRYLTNPVGAENLIRCTDQGRCTRRNVGTCRATYVPHSVAPAVRHHRMET